MGQNYKGYYGLSQTAQGNKQWGEELFGFLVVGNTAQYLSFPICATLLIFLQKIQVQTIIFR